VREKESPRAWLALTDGTHLSGRADACGWLGRAGFNGLNSVSFFLGFSKRFYFLFSLWFSNQIQTNSNMCIKQKNNLGSA
jgi:hypothetical protein